MRCGARHKSHEGVITTQRLSTVHLLTRYNVLDSSSRSLLLNCRFHTCSIAHRVSRCSSHSSPHIRPSARRIRLSRVTCSFLKISTGSDSTFSSSAPGTRFALYLRVHSHRIRTKLRLRSHSVILSTRRVFDQLKTTCCVICYGRYSNSLTGGPGFFCCWCCVELCCVAFFSSPSAVRPLCFIMDGCDELISTWLNVVMRVVGSDDIHFKKSQETLYNIVVCAGLLL